MRKHRGISVFNAAGIVQQRTTHDFDRPLMVVSDRRKRKAIESEEQGVQSVGLFWRMSAELRSSLVTVVRRELPTALQTHRSEKQAHDDEKLQRREEAVQRQLTATIEVRYSSSTLVPSPSPSPSSSHSCPLTPSHPHTLAP